MFIIVNFKSLTKKLGTHRKGMSRNGPRALPMSVSSDAESVRLGQQTEGVLFWSISDMQVNRGFM